MTAFDPVTLEVLRNALEATAQEIGTVLKMTSFSPNIKERMDASCAIFDVQARLVAQAEHVPVHLGAMMKAVAPTLQAIGELAPGDIVLVNDPFIAGAHLPDITVLAPIYSDDKQLLGYVATRAHHSDVGGMEPGSMPGNSREIYQEGIIIPPVRLYRQGVLQEDLLALVLANVRTPEERKGDLNAQIAAVRIGQRRVVELARKYGTQTVLDGFSAILDYAERRMRRLLETLPDGIYAGEDCLDDDGTVMENVPIKVQITVKGDSLTVDFTGSAPPRLGNVNAVAPMTSSATFFAVKLLTDPSLPVNEGTFRPLSIVIPENTFLNAQRPAAVCAGNTETTQRIVDAVLRAFAQFAKEKVPAASQGTMNLISIGGLDPRTSTPYTYIETIAGGQGGRPRGPGMSGVQINMTNTMNTPIESLEIAYPLRVDRYELREGSGGDGLHQGGDGVIRTIKPVEHNARVSFSSDRRKNQPYGLHGGAPGLSGRNLVIEESGDVRTYGSKCSLTVMDGEAVSVETPGGGGWGSA